MGTGGVAFAALHLQAGEEGGGVRSRLHAIGIQQPCQSSRGKEVSASPAVRPGEV